MSVLVQPLRGLICGGVPEQGVSAGWVQPAAAAPRAGVGTGVAVNGEAAGDRIYECGVM